jgi:tight adherence protein C
MSPQMAALVALALWAGSTLLLSELRWFRRRPLVERVAPYVVGGADVRRRGAVMSAASFVQVIGPLARAVGERVARAFGVTEALAIRLERVHSPLDVTGFRVRQLAWSLAGLVGGAVLAVAAGLTSVLALLFVLGGAVLAFLLVEQRLAGESARWQRRIFLELPVVAEQLGMLLGAGYSLGAALSRLAGKDAGARGCARA